MSRFARMTCLFVLAAVALGAVGLAIVLAPPVTGGPATLQATMADVAHRWPGLGHIAPAQLAKRISEGSAVVFDVRTPAEYEVSHLPGAVHIDPNMSTSAFLERYGDSVKGKKVVFYCSVGVRSSALAERVAAGLKARDATAVDDLAGGIFAWHGERRALVDAKGPTDFVHPYDSTWGRLLARPELARTAPGG